MQKQVMYLIDIGQFLSFLSLIFRSCNKDKMIQVFHINIIYDSCMITLKKYVADKCYDRLRSDPMLGHRQVQGNIFKSTF